jgi:hypothetical protein
MHDLKPNAKPFQTHPLNTRKKGTQVIATAIMAMTIPNYYYYLNYI